MTINYTRKDLNFERKLHKHQSMEIVHQSIPKQIDIYLLNGKENYATTIRWSFVEPLDLRYYIIFKNS